MKPARQKKVLVIVCMLLAIYVMLFHYFVKNVHVTYDYQPGDPVLPQRLMYVSVHSSAMNKTAHAVFFPIIWAYESTGHYAFIHDAAEFVE